MDVGLGLGDFVLDGDPVPPKGAQPLPIFGACLLWPNGRPSQLLLGSCFGSCHIEIHHNCFTALLPGPPG